jgi:hypothetical protein
VHNLRASLQRTAANKKLQLQQHANSQYKYTECLQVSPILAGQRFDCQPEHIGNASAAPPHTPATRAAATTPARSAQQNNCSCSTQTHKMKELNACMELHSLQINNSIVTLRTSALSASKRRQRTDETVNTSLTCMQLIMHSSQKHPATSGISSHADPRRHTCRPPPTPHTCDAPAPQLHSPTKAAGAEGRLRVWQSTDSSPLNILFQYDRDPTFCPL